MSDLDNKVTVVSIDPDIFDVDYPLDNLNFVPSFQTNDNTKIFEGLFLDSHAVAEHILGIVIEKCAEVLYVNTEAKKGPDFMLDLLKSRVHLSIETQIYHTDEIGDETSLADEEPSVPVMDTWGRTIVKPGKKREFKERISSSHIQIFSIKPNGLMAF